MSVVYSINIDIRNVAISSSPKGLARGITTSVPAYLNYCVPK